MYLLPAYVSYSFLEEISKLPIDLLDLQKLSEAKGKLEVCQLLLNGLVVKMDKTEASLAEMFSDKECNPYVKALLLSGRKRIIPSNDDFEIIRNNEIQRLGLSPFTQFFLSHEYVNNCGQFELESGHLFHSSAESATYQRIGKFSVEPFRQKESKDWAFLHNFKIPHHSIIIVDPYLLRNEENTHVVNLISGMITPNLKLPYHITLITSNKCINPRFQDKVADLIPRRMHWVEAEVKKSFPGKDINVELIVYNSEDFHDRYIITNNVMIYSGYGFDLISGEGKSKKQTSWIMVNHGKIQEDKSSNYKTHFNTVIDFLSSLKLWIQKKERFSSVDIKNPLLKELHAVTI